MTRFAFCLPLLRARGVMMYVLQNKKKNKKQKKDNYGILDKTEAFNHQTTASHLCII